LEQRVAEEGHRLGGFRILSGNRALARHQGRRQQGPRTHRHRTHSPKSDRIITQLAVYRSLSLVQTEANFAFPSTIYLEAPMGARGKFRERPSDFFMPPA
jgi:hypothetical protein